MHWEGTLLLCAWHVIIFTFDIIRPFQDECEELLSFLRLSFFSVKKKKQIEMLCVGRGESLFIGLVHDHVPFKSKKGEVASLHMSSGYLVHEELK